AGQRTPSAVVDAWMNSAGHRNNILNPDLEYLGVGYYSVSAGYGSYWAQLFYTPL
ncbi:MAG: transporter, partial [Oscillospiraceae bacterium]|nr:transporter [Oscillospiraceae bacterium]